MVGVCVLPARHNTNKRTRICDGGCRVKTIIIAPPAGAAIIAARGFDCAGAGVGAPPAKARYSRNRPRNAPRLIG